MRGLAILLVVCVHTAQRCNLPAAWADVYGFAQLGVQLFFVASALTLFLSMSKRGLNRRELPRFFIRRFFRIAPLYYVGLLFYLAYALAQNRVGIPNALSNYTWPQVASNLFFVHGLYPPGNNTVVPGGWSIGTEMLFYALFPLIFSFLKSARAALIFVFGTLLLNLVLQSGGLWALGQPISVANNSFPYYFILNQLPVFGCGAWLYFLLRDQKLAVSPPARSAWRELAFMLLFAVLVVACWNSAPSFGLAFLLVPTLAGFFFAFLGRFLEGANLNFALARAVAEIGKMSFSIYIFHFFFTRVLTKITLRLPLPSELDFFITFALVLACSYGVALLTSRHIEARGIAWGQKWIERMDAQKSTVGATPAEISR